MKILCIVALIFLMGSSIQSIKMKKYCNCQGAKAITGDKSYYFSGDIKERKLNNYLGNSLVELNRVLVVEHQDIEPLNENIVNNQYLRNKTNKSNFLRFVQVEQQHNDNSLTPQINRFLENGNKNLNNDKNIYKNNISEQRTIIEHDNVNLID
jgi:hypothetical protein